MNPAELFGIAVIIVGLIAWFVRLESEVKNNKEDILALEKAYQLRVAELKLEHDKEYTSLWDKLDTVQKSLNSLLTAVGRVEGRLGAKYE